jgi:hypothetical protein
MEEWFYVKNDLTAREDIKEVIEASPILWDSNVIQLLVPGG